jgi:hypothetical protein
VTTGKSQFAGLAGIVKKQKGQGDTPAPAQTTHSALTLTPPAEKPRAGRVPGKSANPDYERMTVYVRKDTRKAAERKWEDATHGEQDLSDLAESLLTKYLAD